VKVIQTVFVDANLYHDLVTGRGVTGIIHLVNQTTVNWYTKHQPTVETATYGFVFVVARTAIEQVIKLRLTLLCLEISIKTLKYLFGDL